MNGWPASAHSVPSGNVSDKARIMKTPRIVGARRPDATLLVIRDTIEQKSTRHDDPSIARAQLFRPAIINWIQPRLARRVLHP